MHIKYRILFLIFCALAYINMMYADTQTYIKVEITDESIDPFTRSAIETNASKFLTELSDAYLKERNLDLTGFDILDNQSFINQLWKIMQFRPEDQYIGANICKTKTGYCLPNIYMQMLPTAPDANPYYQEASIGFDHSGRIISVDFMTDQVKHEYDKLPEKQYLNEEAFSLRKLNASNRRLVASSLDLINSDSNYIQRRDSTGRECALVKIELPIPNCNFSGNVGDVAFNGKEYTVYLSPLTENFIIKCPGFSSDTIGISKVLEGKSLKSRAIYRMSITGYNIRLSHISSELKDLIYRYDDIEDFRDGVAKVKKGGKMGVIGEDGTEIIPCLYDIIYDFNDGVAITEIGGKYGFIDSSGKEILPCIYDDILEHNIAMSYLKDGSSSYSIVYTESRKFDHNFFTKGLAAVLKDGHLGFVDKQGDISFYSLKDKYDKVYEAHSCILLLKNGKWGIADLRGMEIVQCEYDNVFDYDDMPIDGVAWAKNEGQNRILFNIRGEKITPENGIYLYDFNVHGLAKILHNNKYGLINRDGKIIVPCKYRDINKFKNGRAQVSISAPRHAFSGLNGMIDTLGREIIPCIYDDYFYFNSDGFAKVKLNGKCGMIDRQGNEVIPCQYDGIDFERKDNYIAVSSNGMAGLVNWKNELIIPYKYTNINDFIDGLAWVNKGRKAGIINEFGEEIIPCNKYYTVDVNTNNGLIFIKEDNKWGILDAQGKELMPCIYYGDIWTDFNEGVGCAEIYEGESQKYGCIDKYGNAVIPFNYDKIYYCYVNNHKYFVAEYNGKWGCYNSKGEEIVPCIYDKFELTDKIRLQGRSSIQEYGLGRIKQDDKWGFINMNFEIVVPCIYERIFGFKDGLCVVIRNGKYGVINTSGKEIIPCKYDVLTEFENGLAHFKLGISYGIINLQGEELFF